MLETKNHFFCCEFFFCQKTAEGRFLLRYTFNPMILQALNDFQMETAWLLQLVSEMRFCPFFKINCHRSCKRIYNYSVDTSSQKNPAQLRDSLFFLFIYVSTHNQQVAPIDILIFDYVFDPQPTSTSKMKISSFILLILLHNLGDNQHGIILYTRFPMKLKSF